MKGNKMYSDISRNKGVIVSDLDAVKGYINNLLNTKKGEIPFKREFGTDLEKYLFQPYNFVTVKLIEAEIKRAIARWITIITIKDIVAEFDPDSEQYGITILFKIKGIEEIYDHTMVFSTKEGVNK
jgi:phage baseplate assembly protein W